MFFGIRWGSLRTKIILWSFAPAAITLVAVAMVTMAAYQQVTESLVIERDKDLARLTAEQLAAEVEQYAEVLANEARVADIYQGVASVQQRALASDSHRLAIFDGGVVILNALGQVTAAQPLRSDIIGQDWSDRSYFAETFHSQAPTFSNILADGPDGAEVIVVAVPIASEQDECVGVLAGMFRLGATPASTFYGDLAWLRTGVSGNVFLVDGHGRIIYHSDPSHTGEVFSSQEAVQRVLRGESGALRTRDVHGYDIVASFAPVPGTSWSLVAEEHWSVLSRSGRAYRYFLFMLLGLGVAIPAFVAAIGSARVTHPIREMIVAAQEVASGNFGLRIVSHSGDELEDLARQFNRMSDQLCESYAALEQRVADRTRDLMTVNAIAQTVSQSLDLEAMLASTLDKVLEVLSFESGLIYLRNHKTGELELACDRGISEDIARAGPLPGPRRTASTGDPFIIDDLLLYPEASPQILSEGYRSGANIPLVAKGQVQGVLSVATRRLRHFDQADVDLLVSVGNQIGIAIENARLYEQAQQAATIEERQRLARELHDAVTQTLFSASLIAEVLPRLWERDREAGLQRLEELRQLTRGALAEMRTLLLELRPAVLVDADLVDLLRQLAESITGRVRVPIGVVKEGQRTLPPDVKIAFYRIAQEALNNVAKHANASRASVTLRYLPEGVELRIDDDGQGFDPSQVSSDHLGLGIMVERAREVDAVLRIDAQAGRGTHVRVFWSESRRKEPL